MLTFLLHSGADGSGLLLVDAVGQVQDLAAPRSLRVVAVPVLVVSQGSVQKTGAYLVVIAVTVGGGTEIQVGATEDGNLRVRIERFIVEPAEHLECLGTEIVDSILTVSTPVVPGDSHTGPKFVLAERFVCHSVTLVPVTVGVGNLVNKVLDFFTDGLSAVVEGCKIPNLGLVVVFECLAECGLRELHKITSVVVYVHNITKIPIDCQ